MNALVSARVITANFAINAFFITCLFPITQIPPRGAAFQHKN
jgi:hypothetical protein